jgi:hypothetical protein
VVVTEAGIQKISVVIGSLTIMTGDVPLIGTGTQALL